MYEITQISPQLKLKELVPGKGKPPIVDHGLETDINHYLGGMAGSLGLNKRFEQAVKNLVGEEQFDDLRKTKGFEQAMLQFDRSIKTTFRGDEDDDYDINFPMAHLRDDPDKNLTSNCWAMKG